MSVVEYVWGRSGERLVQGLLVAALQEHAAFRKQLLRRLGIDGDRPIVGEEDTGKGVRYDVVLTGGGAPVRLELKLASRFTKGQVRTLKKGKHPIDVVLCPEGRQDRLLAQLQAAGVSRLPRFASWSDVEQMALGTGAESILRNLSTFTSDPRSLSQTEVDSCIRAFDAGTVWEDWAALRGFLRELGRRLGKRRRVVSVDSATGTRSGDLHWLASTSRLARARASATGGSGRG